MSGSEASRAQAQWEAQREAYIESQRQRAIDKQANIFKIIVKHLIDTTDFSKLDEYVLSRGTSMGEIMKSYNIHRVSNTEEPEPEPEPEPVPEFDATWYLPEPEPEPNSED